ncbi:hypothetical protein SBP1_gp006 [Vibrio virus vB_VspP_SBP1]|uniref:Uncharacterized protein n=1 Tax=Vibrio virus vB_VspP_SBP1 TaxID=2500581 RepID=A0A3T0IIE3_9CAUD|nr:hypothetical protein KNU36_gp006 [Vibrio virus vB_VspP_SBP1]AZU99598.1 hypothetical protein SBP1_gp006 [Vibrio virus vB_VspP_SBP1]
MWYEILKITQEVIDVDCDVRFEDGALEIDLKIKIPIAKEIENMYCNLTSVTEHNPKDP